MPSKHQNERGQKYDDFKEFQGQKYTGMRVGVSHHWNYDEGQWKETKQTPDLWKISYLTNKHRKGKAPEGSGVPVGTEYHWYILAHQMVRKLDANTYSTAMTGYKYKLAHKRADKESWNVSYNGQRRRLIKLLRDVLTELEKEEVEDKKRKPRKQSSKAAKQLSS